MPTIRSYRLNHVNKTVIVDTTWDRETKRYLSGDLAEGTVIGRIIGKASCKMRVGCGAKVHAGYTIRYVIDVEDLSVRTRYATVELTAGEHTTEPFNSCGAHATNGNYARNRNRVAEDDLEVTCTKCLAQRAKNWF